MFCCPKQNFLFTEKVSKITAVICSHNALKTTITICCEPPSQKVQCVFFNLGGGGSNKDYNHFILNVDFPLVEKRTEKQDLLKWALNYLDLFLISKDPSIRD